MWRRIGVVAVAVAMVACGDEVEGNGDGPERPGRDVGSRDDAASADDAGVGGDDSGENGGGESYADFETAWGAYVDAVVAVGAYACPCMISFGGYPSQQACESDVRQQIESQAFCYKFALQQSEAEAFDYIGCYVAAAESSVACYEAMTEPVGCMNMDGCSISDESDAACMALLTDDQRASMDACAPEEDDGF